MLVSMITMKHYVTCPYRYTSFGTDDAIPLNALCKDVVNHRCEIMKKLNLEQIKVDVPEIPSTMVPETTVQKCKALICFGWQKSKYLDDTVVCKYCNRIVGLWLLRGHSFDVEKQHHKWCIFASDTSRHTDGWQCRHFVLQCINSSKDLPITNWAAKAEVWKSALMPRNIPSLIREKSAAFLRFIYVPFLPFRVVTPRALKIVLRLALTGGFDGTGLRACDPTITPFLPFRGKEALRLPEIRRSYVVQVQPSMYFSPFRANLMSLTFLRGHAMMNDYYCRAVLSDEMKCIQKKANFAGESGTIDEANREHGRGTRLWKIRLLAGKVEEVVSRGRTGCLKSLTAGSESDAGLLDGGRAFETLLFATTTEPSSENRN
ncbi:hypothetical protein WUBG_09965 [Wuchereria bancrofti]|uniref:Uncharacterized protein n=1 Tax=Wuchereria bancrofti TaxID=6293 RepID=J9EQ06_WUCBA|nr:hypothetical protein WUBG_09965 [Wuchereria bancrofti]